MSISLHVVQPGPTTLFSIFLAILLLPVSDQKYFTLLNQCEFIVRPASSDLKTNHLYLDTGGRSKVWAPPAWNGTIWGRTLCRENLTTRGNLSCMTGGDCGTGKLPCDGMRGVLPATLAEFRLNNNGLDFYKVNVVEGFNIPISVVPIDAFGENLNCSSAGCPTDINNMCPTEFKVMVDERVVACQGACSTENFQNFCCLKNKNSTSKTCEPSDYSLKFKTACPQAYSHPNDNGTTFTCSTNFYKIIFCPASSMESSNQNVSVGDSLIAGNGENRWLSPSGEFAFGFYQLSNGLFLLAIWYEKIKSEDAIIWYAKGENPTPKGSTLVLNDSHGLMLTNPEGLELWRSSYFTSSKISIGLMKDDGNFQLLDQNYVILWKSFSDSTDTLVPGQELNLNRCLYSRQGEFNFSRGMFELCLQKNGHGLLLNLVNFPRSTQNEFYYESDVVDPNNEPLNAGDKLIFDNLHFYLYILTRDGGNISITDPKDYVSNDAHYYKATITYDGVFTLSYHPKVLTNNRSWIMAMTILENICLNSTFNEGHGFCGLNSICSLTKQRAMCTCPEGYSLMDSNNMYGGCMQNSHVICEGKNQNSQNDTHEMVKFPETYWPYSDYETKSPCSLPECEESCLKDCLCAWVYFNESSCWKKKLPLSHGRRDFSIKGISIMKMRKNDSQQSLSNVEKDNGTLITVMSIILGFSIAIIITLIGAIFYWYNSKEIKSSTTNKRVVDRNLRIFSFKEITEVTNNFREELGRGSCSIVYKGIVDLDTCVAVKKLDKLFQDSDKEFQIEMNVIVKTHHRNLVRLHGYCSEDQHRILVYEFMSNGTLARFLFTPLKPNWNQRVEIAIGIARGLVYLHEECCSQIIHCDIKPQNILLDDDYNAKISDFGLAKLLLINQSHTKTGIRGTKGYIAPDWFRSAPITAKVDAYSFGVLLLEIICCRKNVEDDNVSEEKRILTDWAYDCYTTGKVDILLENECEAFNDMSRFEKFVMISIWCTQEDPSLRPPMKKVLLMLEGIVEVKIPPSPYLYGSSN